MNARRGRSLDSFLSLAHAFLITTDDNASKSGEFILACIFRVIAVQCEFLSQLVSSKIFAFVLRDNPTAVIESHDGSKTQGSVKIREISWKSLSATARDGVKSLARSNKSSSSSFISIKLCFLTNNFLTNGKKFARKPFTEHHIRKLKCMNR